MSHHRFTDVPEDVYVDPLLRSKTGISVATEAEVIPSPSSTVDHSVSIVVSCTKSVGLASFHKHPRRRIEAMDAL